MSIIYKYLIIGLIINCVIAVKAQVSKHESRPNIVIFFADDLGYSDVGCYGGEILTPNLDKLAGEGMRFGHFINQSKCAPSRASLLTGLHAVEAGCMGSPEQMINGLTIAELLKSAGYSTYMTGKWHAKEEPIKRGFDRHFGKCNGAFNYFSPSKRERYFEDGKSIAPFVPENPETFYTTDAFSNKAIEYLETHKGNNNPFLLYVAYNAPHWPLQAPKEDIDKYRGKYLKGWDVISRERYDRMKEIGIIDSNWKLPQRDVDVPAWKDFERKDDADLTMATYAAMVDRMDQNIGRVLDKLDDIGVANNTLVIFLSDNGACAEGKMWDGIDPKSKPGIKNPPAPNKGAKLGIEWANACNTPYRKYKRSMFNGGQLTPFIARWPKVIENKGTITFQKGHIVDLMPTFAELAEVDYPEGEVWNVPAEGDLKTEWTIRPCSGKSLLPVFQNKEVIQPEVIMGHYQGGRMMIQGDHKLVSDGGDGSFLHLYDYPWEMYNLKDDGTETHNLASDNVAYVDSMDAIYRKWINEMDDLNKIKSHTFYQPHLTKQQRLASNELEKNDRLQKLMSKREVIGKEIVVELEKLNLKMKTHLSMDKHPMAYFGIVTLGKAHIKTKELKELYCDWDTITKEMAAICSKKGNVYSQVWNIQEKIRTRMTVDELEKQ